MASPLTLRAAPACARGGRQRRARGSSKSTLETTTSSSSLLVVPRAVSNRSGSNSIADPKEVLLNDAEFLLDAHEKVRALKEASEKSCSSFCFRRRRTAGTLNRRALLRQSTSLFSPFSLAERLEHDRMMPEA